MGKLERLMLDPYPLRTITKKVLRTLRLGSYEQRLKWGTVDRPHYVYCVYNAAVLAKKLGYPRMSVVEFGVAGGEGLVSFERHAQQISKLLAVDIDIYGFDTGQGLPPPLDYRDLKYHWRQGFFKMDVGRLRTRLKKAELVLGDIQDTSNGFFEKYNPAPIGAISYDVDYYSSTVAALKMLGAGERFYLPRVFCYFDDTIGSEIELYNDYTGQRLAIHEFNQSHLDTKLAIPYHLLGSRAVESWYHQIWILHFFQHSRYNDFISEEDQQLSLNCESR